MKRRWRDRCCFVVLLQLFAIPLDRRFAQAFVVANELVCQPKIGGGANTRKSQRRFAAKPPFSGGRDESERRSNNEVQPSRRKSSPPKHAASSSASSLKFRDMQDLLDSLSSPNETLLIVFTATNCGPCKLQKQELSEFRQRLTSELLVEPTDDGTHHDPVVAVAAQLPSDAAVVPLKMLAIDTEKWPHVGLAWFKVSKLPCVVVLRNKQVVARMEGLTRANDLLEHVRPHLLP